MVLAQDPAAAGQGVLVQGAGLHVLTQRAQSGGEVTSKAQEAGVVDFPPGLNEGVCPAGEGYCITELAASVPVLGRTIK